MSEEVGPHNLAMFNMRCYQNIYRGSRLNESSTRVGGRDSSHDGNVWQHTSCYESGGTTERYNADEWKIIGITSLEYNAMQVIP